MFSSIVKRDGRRVPYENVKITYAIGKAMESCNRFDKEESEYLSKRVEEKLVEKYQDRSPSVEDIQDMVEETLKESGYNFVARKYMIYRNDRTRIRDMNSKLMKVYNEITFQESTLSDLKRDNANIDGDTAMGTMLKYGSEGAKEYYEKYLLKPEQSKAHKEGDIHIHDFDFYALTTTCCQIDIKKLFQGGFSTGHGHLREPNDIRSYAALACIAIQSNQNDQHGGQSIPNFDYGLSDGVKKTFLRIYTDHFIKAMELLSDGALSSEEIRKRINALPEKPSLAMGEAYHKAEQAAFMDVDESVFKKVQEFAKKTSFLETDRATYQAMEALIHNLNTMHSRAGAQTPFSSINYGTDTSEEGRMVIKNILLATEAGLGEGETAIFPIHIFKVKDGVNYNPGDPNYDLFQLAIRVSAKRMFPNFSFLDAPFNLQYYQEGKPETEISYMGCRTRVIGNTYDKNREITFGRGNLSFTSVNLPRIALQANGNIDWFFEELERKLTLVTAQLTDRFAIQSKKRVKNFPFLMGQGIWMDSDQLEMDDEIGEVLKHGTLSVGFIGLAEALVALIGSHHGETKEAKNLGLEIVSFMREYLDRLSEETRLNYTLLATPAEGLAGRFVNMDRKKFGLISGVTDKEYYTNSFHIPVYYKINSYDKIKAEAPYHGLTNAGHITYIELDGDTAKNLSAFESIIRIMKEEGIGYGSINHPLDRDPVCGFNGIIGENCPKCGRSEEQHGFERIRRITGYLVGTLDRFNNAKRAEERDRIKHGTVSCDE